MPGRGLALRLPACTRLHPPYLSACSISHDHMIYSLAWAFEHVSGFQQSRGSQHCNWNVCMQHSPVLVCLHPHFGVGREQLMQAYPCQRESSSLLTHITMTDAITLQEVPIAWKHPQSIMFQAVLIMHWNGFVAICKCCRNPWL